MDLGGGGDHIYIYIYKYAKQAWKSRFQVTTRVVAAAQFSSVGAGAVNSIVSTLDSPTSDLFCVFALLVSASHTQK